MSDIFISYSSADRQKAKLLADMLSARGWAVWWDRAIPPGKTFDEVIERALDSAKCIVVLWSKTSASSNWVKAEAGEGLRREILVPVLLEDVKIPLEFRRIQAASLTGWQGESSDQEIDKLLVAIESLLGSPVSREERTRSREFKVSGEHAEDFKRGADQRPAPKGPESFPSDKDREPNKMSPTKGGLVGAVVGVPVGMLTNILIGALPSDTLFAGIVLGLAGAIVGAVCRDNRSLLFAAAIGAVVGGIIWATFDPDESDVAIRTVVFGGPAGAILGIILWKVIRKK